MKKYLIAFTNTLFFFGCLLLGTNAAKAVTIKNKLIDFRLLSYQATGTIHNQGVIGDVMAAVYSKKNALAYVNTQLQPLYTGCGSLLSVGGGYRWAMNSLWVVGVRGHIEGGALPHSLGYYAKFSPGIEAHTLRGSLNFNMYLPITAGNFNAPMNQSEVEVRDYKGHKQRLWRYMEQDHFSCDLVGDLVLPKNIRWGLGFYGATQVNNSAILGGMTRLEYAWNDFVKVQLKYSVDTFRSHSFIGGIQFRKRSVTQGNQALHQLLWSPLDRHVAPIQMLHADTIEKETYHLFFDSNAKASESIEASYENPSPRLNNAIYNDVVRKALKNQERGKGAKIISHLSGFFDLTNEKEAALTLQPGEHIRGEICQEGTLCTSINCEKDAVCRVDLLKYLDFERNNLRLHPNDLHLKGKKASTLIVGSNTQSIKGVLEGNDSHMQKGSTTTWTHTALKILAQNERVIDGRAILKGSVEMNDDTSLFQIAILPADERKKSNIHMEAHPPEKRASDELGVAVHKNSYRQTSAIVVPKLKGKSSAHNVKIEDVVISGWPLAEPSYTGMNCYQYVIGIELNRCKDPTIRKVQINNANTAMLFNGVYQTRKSHDTQNPHQAGLRAIYIGSPHLAMDVEHTDPSKRVDKVKSGLLAITNAPSKESKENACQKMVENLSTRTVAPKELLKHIKGINLEAFPESIQLTNLDIESKVLVGVDVQSNNVAQRKSEQPSSKVPSKGWMQKAREVKNTVVGLFVAQGQEKSAQKPKEERASRIPTHSILDISDAHIMTQILPVRVSNQSSLSLHRCVLGTHYLGGVVQSANLKLVGTNAEKRDSFVYVQEGISPSQIKEAAKELVPTKGIPAEYSERLPNVFYVDHNRRTACDTEVTAVNTGVVVAVPNTRSFLNSDQKINSQRFFLGDMQNIEFMQDQNNSLQDLQPAQVKNDKDGDTQPARIKVRNDTTNAFSVVKMSGSYVPANRTEGAANALNSHQSTEVHVTPQVKAREDGGNRLEALPASHSNRTAFPLRGRFPEFVGPAPAVSSLNGGAVPFGRVHENNHDYIPYESVRPLPYAPQESLPAQAPINLGKHVNRTSGQWTGSSSRNSLSEDHPSKSSVPLAAENKAVNNNQSKDRDVNRAIQPHELPKAPRVMRTFESGKGPVPLKLTSQAPSIAGCMSTGMHKPTLAFLVKGRIPVKHSSDSSDSNTVERMHAPPSAHRAASPPGRVRALREAPMNNLQNSPPVSRTSGERNWSHARVRQPPVEPRQYISSPLASKAPSQYAHSPSSDKARTVSVSSTTSNAFEEMTQADLLMQLKHYGNDITQAPPELQNAFRKMQGDRVAGRETRLYPSR